MARIPSGVGRPVTERPSGLDEPWRFGAGGTRQPGAFRRARAWPTAARSGPRGGVTRSGGSAPTGRVLIVMFTLVGGLAGGGDPVIIAIPYGGIRNRGQHHRRQYLTSRSHMARTASESQLSSETSPLVRGSALSNLYSTDEARTAETGEIQDRTGRSRSGDGVFPPRPGQLGTGGKRSQGNAKRELRPWDGTGRPRVTPRSR